MRLFSEEFPLRSNLVRWLRMAAVACEPTLPLLAVAQTGSPNFSKELLDQLAAPIAFPQAAIMMGENSGWAGALGDTSWRTAMPQ